MSSLELPERHLEGLGKIASNRRRERALTVLDRGVGLHGDLEPVCHLQLGEVAAYPEMYEVRPFRGRWHEVPGLEFEKPAQCSEVVELGNAGPLFPSEYRYVRDAEASTQLRDRPRLSTAAPPFEPFSAEAVAGECESRCSWQGASNLQVTIESCVPLLSVTCSEQGVCSDHRRCRSYQQRNGKCRDMCEDACSDGYPGWPVGERSGYVS